MLLGVVADDFTGASDIANTLAKGYAGEPGLSTTQFLGIPSAPARADCEAGVVSLKSRSIPAADAIAQSLAALDWLKAQGCRQFLFKYCSTFDSTPEGNIGPVGEALADRLGVKGVVACPAFPGAGRTIYMGHLFVGGVPLNESSLRTHPLNPMTDSDLRRWLKQQTRTDVGGIVLPTVRQGGAAVKAALEMSANRGDTLVIVDAITDDDLIAIGEAVADAPLITGGSGIALGLPRNFAANGLSGGRPVTIQGIDGPEAILAGSCSQTTLGQIAHHRETHPVFGIAVDDVMSGAVNAALLVEFIETHRGKAPLVYSSDTPEAVAASQKRHGREAVAASLDALFAETARRLVDGGVTRLVVAGGETSGAVVTALGLDALTIGPEIAAGVPVLYNPRPLALALKSGNFGQSDFFVRALSMMAAGMTPER